MVSRRNVYSRVFGPASLLAAAVVTAGSMPASAAASDAPVAPDFPTALAYAQFNPEAEPAGSNDWSCRPTERHPRPVVLAHGTWENRYNNFAKLSPELKRRGYCVYALNYGAHGLSFFGMDPSVKGHGDIRVSAKELASFVDKVRAASGASQVDIVGHSQGGILARQYMKFEGGADPANPRRNKVRNLVTLGATHHGTTLSGLGTLSDKLGLAGFSPILLGEAGKQQLQDSEFIRNLNAGGDTLPGVNYQVIATRYDEITTPYESTFLKAGPGATVHNVTLQDGCPLDGSEHVSMSYSPRLIGYVDQGLDDSAAPAPCEPNLPVL